MNKKSLSERDICTKFITPALEKAGWDTQLQILEEVSFTDGKIYVRGKITARGTRKRADYILYYKPNIPIAIIEAKDNNQSVRAGIQQGLDYARILDIPCVFSSNGDGFLFHDRTATDGNIEKEIGLDEFPSPEQLWEKYKKYKGIATPEAEKIASQDYYFDGTNRKPRYYQQIAVNRTVEAIASGQNRILLVMATGTGKTYTAFQIIHRLWKSGAKKRILFLADRNALIDQTRRGDFKHFKDKMTVVKHRQIDKSFEIYLALYQGLSGTDESANVYKQFSRDFFDLIVIDECHRGSAKDDSSWREILTYFQNATHIGLTATPKETNEASNTEYFGDPVYTYSLRQGIDDGFLAPYRVLRIALNVDAEGWRPEQGKTDKDGNEIEDRIYNRRDFDKNLVIEERTDLVAKKLTEFLKGYDRFAKTIVFCVDIDHAERMRTALARHNPDLVAENYKYVMQITGDNDEGKRELDNFINPEEKYPVIATTSELMTTGVDAQTCKVIVLDSNINSITKFKQIIGRGTRINEEYGKLYFTILDFRNATDLFADPAFDGDPIRIKPVTEETDLGGIIDEEETQEEPIIDIETGEEIILEQPEIRYPEPIFPETEAREPRQKVYVNGVDVSVLISRELHFDQHGRPITTSLKDHTKEIIKEQFASLDDFLNKWNNSDRKEAIIAELIEQGVMVEALYEAVDKQVDLFDLICHVAYDQPPLTRKERANNVKKRNYFTKYGDQARKVLEALLEKYADQGIENIENIQILTVPPINEFGSVTEIIKAFGSREEYEKAIRDLENELYKVA
ncbi:EcoAI/FtnUII family type I restriction enzme subunit R [Tenuifilum sp.]|uniref:EcoAI/FtnUII family type I restriction enzme subunit R n=1 Tax=Tenuifilum sp. TaxID=2760880 RepID=UPI001B5387A6|nr:DEAD/DEAH box helicase family protein [Bacteroidales bacterium]HOJ66554.1 DEAD/DEAH box helicase family protein [Paludibacteraceae bacterium]HQE54275.1 DEAD/DEAH box helicase family protein [Tenuifilum sp.]HPD59496.1 DEAD/DEAH box helicase family protein [Paludibacteraceae bacterium]HQI88267.1 DEAD/DEAH box helicase family protein [Tenuifilum sp.]